VPVGSHGNSDSWKLWTGVIQCASCTRPRQNCELLVVRNLFISRNWGFWTGKRCDAKYDNKRFDRTLRVAFRMRSVRELSLPVGSISTSIIRSSEEKKNLWEETNCVQLLIAAAQMLSSRGDLIADPQESWMVAPLTSADPPKPK
jgi:hypothetical protein